MPEKRPMLKRFSWFVVTIALLAGLAGDGYSQDPSGRPTDPNKKKTPTKPKKVEPKVPTVILTVVTQPPGSSVYLNGEVRGTTNAEGKLVLDKLPLGKYTVEVRKEGFASKLRGFQAGPDSPTLVFTLDPKFEDITKDFDALIAAGTLTGPDSPSALELVNTYAKRFPDRPEVSRMRGVLAAKLVEKIMPVIERTIANWRGVTRAELVSANQWASEAGGLRRDDNRLQAEASYLGGVIALRDWQSAGPGVDGGAEGPTNALGLSVARTELEKAVAFDDAWAPAWYQLGMVRLHVADLAGAETAFKKVAQLEPKWALGNVGLGLTYYTWAKYKESVEAYRKATEIDRKSVAGFAGLGLARAAKGERDGVKDIRRAMDMDGTSALPHLYLGMVYAKSKKQDEISKATEELKRAIEKNPYNLEFQNRTAQELIAELARK